MEQFGWKGIFEGHLAQPSHNEQGHLEADQAAQSLTQPDIQFFLGWVIYHLCGKLTFRVTYGLMLKYLICSP